MRREAKSEQGPSGGRPCTDRRSLITSPTRKRRATAYYSQKIMEKSSLH